MLSNSDFRQLLEPKKGGDGSMGGQQNITKLDIKTIANWDNENRKQNKIKHNQRGRRYTDDSNAVTDGTDSAVVNKKEKMNGGEDVGITCKYRDRAEERRLNVTVAHHNNEYDVDMEVAASRLSAEQTKFLGGDESRTHLVKGLDFLLLQKNRSKAEGSRDNNISTVISSSSSRNRGGSDSAVIIDPIHTHTEMGARLKALLLSCGDSKGSGSTHKNKSYLQSIRYEFDMSLDFYQEIPTLISGSKKEISGGKEGREERASADLPQDLLERLSDYVRTNPKGGKKRKLSDTTSNIAKVSVDKASADKAVVDIYGDIFDDVGLNLSAEAAPSIMQNVAVLKGTKASSLGLFSSSTSRGSADVKGEEGEDMMAPVKTLLRAQAIRDQASNAAMIAATTPAVPEASSTNNNSTKGLVHRNVFGVDELTVVRKGDALAYGSYDMFGGDDGSDDGDDNDDENDEVGKKLNWNKEKKGAKAGSKKQ